MCSGHRFGHEAMLMIDINLIKPQKKKNTKITPVFLGIDIRAINVKAVLITIVGCYIGQFAISWFLGNRVEGYRAESTSLQKTFDDLKKELTGKTDLEKKLDEFNKKIQELKQREVEVNDALSKSSNPYKLLEDLARSMPEDLWFSKIQITSENEIRFEGSCSFL